MDMVSSPVVFSLGEAKVAIVVVPAKVGMEIHGGSVGGDSLHVVIVFVDVPVAFLAQVPIEV